MLSCYKLKSPCPSKHFPQPPAIELIRLAFVCEVFFSLAVGHVELSITRSSQSPSSLSSATHLRQQTKIRKSKSKLKYHTTTCTCLDVGDVLVKSSNRTATPPTHSHVLSHTQHTGTHSSVLFSSKQGGFSRCIRSNADVPLVPNIKD